MLITSIRRQAQWKGLEHLGMPGQDGRVWHVSQRLSRRSLKGLEARLAFHGSYMQLLVYQLLIMQIPQEGSKSQTLLASLYELFDLHHAYSWCSIRHNDTLGRRQGGTKSVVPFPPSNACGGVP